MIKSRSCAWRNYTFIGGYLSLVFDFQNTPKPRLGGRGRLVGKSFKAHAIPTFQSTAQSFARVPVLSYSQVWRRDVSVQRLYPLHPYHGRVRLRRLCTGWWILGSRESSMDHFAGVHWYDNAPLRRPEIGSESARLPCSESIGKNRMPYRTYHTISRSSYIPSSARINKRKIKNILN